MKEKGHVLLLVVFLIALVVGGVLYYQKQVKPSPVQQTVQSSPSPVDANVAPNGSAETANWKTYTNEIYRLSLKYPDTDLMYKCGGEPTNKADSMTDPVDGTEIECVAFGDISINFFEGSFAAIRKNDKNSKGTLKKISGKSAYVTVREASERNTERIKTVYIEQSPKKTIYISGIYNSSRSIALFDTVLSTFKFLDQK